MPDKWAPYKFSWEVVKGVALAVIGRLSFLASQNSQKARVAATERAKQSELDINAYELVEKALSQDPKTGTGHGIAAAAIVNAITKPPLQNELQNALRAGIKDPTLLQKLDNALQFDRE